MSLCRPKVNNCETQFDLFKESLPNIYLEDSVDSGHIGHTNLTLLEFNKSSTLLHNFWVNDLVAWWEVMLLADRFCKNCFAFFSLFVFREFITQKLNAKKQV